MQSALAGLDAKTHLHVSFDVDFLDPSVAPGVATTIRGGPTYREAQLCMEMIADTGCLASLDVMELNPALDVRNQTAEVPVLQRLHSRQTPHDLLDDVALHVAVEQAFFGFFGQHR